MPYLYYNNISSETMFLGALSVSELVVEKLEEAVEDRLRMRVLN